MHQHDGRFTAVRLRDKALVWRELGEEVVVLDLTTSRYLRVNAAGAMLWSELATERSPAELAERLVERFSIPFQQAAADVAAFVSGLRAHGLLQE